MINGNECKHDHDNPDDINQDSGEKDVCSTTGSLLNFFVFLSSVLLGRGEKPEPESKSIDRKSIIASELV